MKRLVTEAPDGVFVTTPDNRILLWNRAAECLVGYRARDAVGRRCRDVMAGRTAAGAPRCLTGCDIAPALAVDGLDQTFEMQTWTKSGDARWLSVTAFAVGSARRRTPLVFHVLRDVTSSKRLHQRVREQLSGTLRSDSAASPGLTGRELQVLRLLASGLGTSASAERLGVSGATIRNHVQNIFAKLGVHSRLEAVAYATRRRLL